ncbi:histone-lysine N-methyltransferase 2B-like [Boleophthalmus pectinirostris]|uniref:histone-lysine N-methyltransferase 2B-like n=1 Tax=Boleophthalmus pectinirostris TaxID=150288 RepID=UPI002430615B|nr:histone-lysine N-methyltransferase 2B-like [Boleophthalmus pectinirostris]
MLCTRTHVHERLRLVLRSLQDLDQRRVCQKVLVQSVLDPQGVLLKTGLNPQEPELNPDQNHRDQNHEDQNHKDQNHEDQDENLQLQEQLTSLRTRDSGLLSQIQDLEHQILELRLDADRSHDPPPRPRDSPESPAPESPAPESHAPESHALQSPMPSPCLPVRSRV